MCLLPLLFQENVGPGNGVKVLLWCISPGVFTDGHTSERGGRPVCVPAFFTNATEHDEPSPRFKKEKNRKMCYKKYVFKNSGPQRDFQGCTEGPFERPYKAASQCTVHQIGPSVFTGPPHTGPYCGLRNTPEWLWLLTRYIQEVH